MNKQIEKPNTGVLFSSKAKKTEKSPDYFGDMLIDLSAFQIKDGKIEVRLGGWKRQSKTGSTYLSLAASAPKDQGYAPKSKVPQSEDDPF